MKNLIILLLTVISMTLTSVYASTLTTEKEETTTTAKTLLTDKGVFTEPGYDLFRRNGSIDRLRSMLIKKSQKELNLVTPTSRSFPMSRFQLIIDKNGSVIDCTILESTDMSKDQTVSKFVQSGTFFQSPATLDGKPCNALGIFTIRYSRAVPNAEGFEMRFDFYPLMDTTE